MNEKTVSSDVVIVHVDANGVPSGEELILGLLAKAEGKKVRVVRNGKVKE